ncbi:bifunctional diguanylate cyclase/phosphodiesterase [Roseibium aquae]|uniref:Bifunctional diguanylate cyclase/phosphodiesterase n=1 Tax=Roseibium aquae TaxID=1323746 RepID=A0A916TMP5_9HYPH|nr:bifunctional diguanylate cyclase/phosphodiesterase [Roseibium aquae]
MANAIILPMFAIVAIALASVFGLMVWSSNLSDQAAERSERQLLNGAIDLKLDQMAKQQVGSVVLDQAYFKASGPIIDREWVTSNIARRLYNTHGFTETILINRAFEPSFTYSATKPHGWVSEALLDAVEPAVAKVRARYITGFKRTPSGLFSFRPDFRINERSLSETGLVVVDGVPHFMSASAIVPELQSIAATRQPPTVLINLRPINATVLEGVSTVSSLRDLLVSKTPNDADGIASTALHNPRGKVVGFIDWQVSSPGTTMMTRITPVFAILALAIVGLTLGVMTYIRQTTRQLARSEAQAVHTARHDSLSGLPNRDRFKVLLDKALSNTAHREKGIAVIYIDLDRFKDINDTLGHGAGDTVIRAIASRINSVLPEDGVVARISGDEFAMFIRDARGREWIEHILTRIQDQLTIPIRIGRNELHVSLSIGVAMCPQDGTRSADLLRKADIALYDAKAAGRGRWSFFDPLMEHHIHSQDRIARDLRKAIDDDTLELAYQPQCGRDGNRILSVEALARWTAEDGTPIPPSRFIPIAEDTGLINDLGLWVLRRACADAERWPDMLVSVNVSPTQFKHPRFVEKVVGTLADFNLPPARLEIEVTESVFAGRDKEVLHALKRLKDLGVKVALDDFGSGYSSLSYLRRFPFDTLKIDRDFLHNVEDNQEARDILQIMVQLGKVLGMTIVAEGVESAAQYAFLQDIGCHRMQGYYISRPLSADNLVAFLQDFEKRAGMDRGVAAPMPLIAAKG